MESAPQSPLSEILRSRAYIFKPLINVREAGARIIREARVAATEK